MSPTARVALAAVVLCGSALVVMSAASESWFHAPYGIIAGDDSINWDGFGGPSDEHDGLNAADLLSIAAGLSAFIAPLCGLLVGFGAIAGRRRDHVPRLPALLGWLFAAAAVLLQALAIATWPIAKQPEPRGFGWAMPVYFIAVAALLVSLVFLWRDASRRARASAAALAKVNRELAARDLASIPEAEPEEPPVERL